MFFNPCILHTDIVYLCSSNFGPIPANSLDSCWSILNPNVWFIDLRKICNLFITFWLVSSYLVCMSFFVNLLCVLFLLALYLFVLDRLCGVICNKYSIRLCAWTYSWDYIETCIVMEFTRILLSNVCWLLMDLEMV